MCLSPVVAFWRGWAFGTIIPRVSLSDPCNVGALLVSTGGGSVFVGTVRSFLKFLERSKRIIGGMSFFSVPPLLLRCSPHAILELGPSLQGVT